MANKQLKVPGVYIDKKYPEPAPALQTGVPLFLGYTAAGLPNEGYRLTGWPQYEEKLGAPQAGGYLAAAVRGFFENDGDVCYVMPLDHDVEIDAALDAALSAAAAMETIDLLCAPDLLLQDNEVARLQQKLLDHCQTSGDRLAILDCEKDAEPDDVLAQRSALHGDNGALYYPWVLAGDRFVPPCGHVAGVYTRSDRRSSVHKAPANEPLFGVLDLQTYLDNALQAELNPEGVNCLRAFPGRGIRVWGARTLSEDDNWRYVNMRRLFLTVGRWIELNLATAVFEPHDARLWARVERNLSIYFTSLHKQGALRGRTASEAFYVKCDAETNPAEVRDAGKLVTEIGLAAAVPFEFIKVRIIHTARGVTIEGFMELAA